jgi:hypothetical protein
MNTISNVSMRAIPDPGLTQNLAKTIALFCDCVSGSSLYLAVHDLDLNAGIF